MNKARGLFIPAGRIQRFRPSQPASVKSLADERDRKHRLNTADETLNDLNKQILKLVVVDKQTKWQSAVDKCNHRTGIPHRWRLAKGLSGKKTRNSPSIGDLFADKTYLDQRMIAIKFNHQFTPQPIRLSGDKSKRQLKRLFHQLPLIGTPSFAPADIKEAIRLAKSSTAIEPDWMSTLHIKTLAHGAINYLTNIFNLSISSGQIPEVWHKARIIQILKPSKESNIGKTWRPISLLCPAEKTPEELRLIHIPFHPAQHGFRSRVSTYTALSSITADIAAGFSRKKPVHRTVLIVLVLTAEFDNVNHQQ